MISNQFVPLIFKSIANGHNLKTQLIVRSLVEGERRRWLEKSSNQLFLVVWIALEKVAKRWNAMYIHAQVS